MHPSHWDNILVENAAHMRESNGERTKNDEIVAAILKYHIKERLPLHKLQSVHFNQLIDGEQPTID